MLKSCLILLILISIQDLSAHTRFSTVGSLTSRSTNSGIKTGPCGGLARTATPNKLQMGSTINVQWEETIQHPGRFEFYFSNAGDANFTLLKTVIDNQDNVNTPHQFSTAITLPNTACTNCTLQLIQVMTENPAAPTLYYSCADIELSSSAAPPPGPAPAPTPTPSPSPNPQPAGCK